MDRSSYFIKDKALFGTYPIQKSVKELEAHGVRYFIDLTDTNEKGIVPYTTKYEYMKYPIKDMTAPKNYKKFEEFICKVSKIIKNLKPNTSIYVHCRGGHGRAGVVVACLYIYMLNMSPDKALELTAKAHNERKVMKDKWRIMGSPQTKKQKLFVHNFFTKLQENPDRKEKCKGEYDEYIANISTLSFEEMNKAFNEEDLDLLHKIKLHIDNGYEYGDVELEDEQYDLLVDIIKKRDPKYKQPIGFKIRDDDNRVKVPYHMGSMNKIRPHIEDEVKFFKKWKKEYKSKEYIIEDKLDGVSCLIVVKNGKCKLYKRPGRDGFGADISTLLPYLTSIPSNLEDGLIVRGELIMEKKVFYKSYIKTEKRKNGYRTPRGMVAGITGAKTLRKGIKDILFVAYEKVYEDGIIGLKPSSQISELESIGFITVSKIIANYINIMELTEMLKDRKDDSPYEIDGIIVQPNLPYERNLDGNPEYAFAYKMRSEDSIKESEVKKVIWKISRRGKIKPRIELEDPVIINGYSNLYATAFNAKYVKNNNLGPGSVIRITRSGDVIPYIIEVVQGSDEPQMPNYPFKWDKNGTDIYVTNSKQNEKCIMILKHFFLTMRIKNLGESTISKLYNHGINTVFKILMSTKEDFEKVDGFGKDLALKVYSSIHNTLKNGVTITEILDGSGIFGEGIGGAISSQLLSHIPNLFTIYKTISKKDLFQLITSVPGFGPVRSQKIVDNINWADMFVQAITLFSTIKTVKLVNDNLKGKVFVFTGKRDKNLEEQIVLRGGKITGSVSKNTTALVIATTELPRSGKRKKAFSLNIPEYTKDNFITKYLE